MHALKGQEGNFRRVPRQEWSRDGSAWDSREALRGRRTILFVETGNYGGGSFGSLYQTVAALDRARFLPIVVYLNRTPYLGKMHDLGVEAYQVGDVLYNNVIPDFSKRILVGVNWSIGSLCPRLLPRYETLLHVRPLRFLRRIVRERGVDLIHLNNTMVRHFFCIAGLHDLGPPIVSHLRSFIAKGVNPFMAEYSNRHLARYIAYSDGVKDFWVNAGVEEGRVEVIPNGIEIEDIPPLNVWERMGIEPRKGPLLGCVGAVKANRTYDYMLRSFVHILKEEPDAFLVIVGSWMERGLGEKLQKLAGELGISRSVKLHGHDPAARRIIAGLDLLVLPYRVEPYSRVLLEAWLARTPVVATRVGRIDRIIEHGKDGLLLEHGNEQAMKEAVLRLWRNRDFRQSIGREGRRTVERRFSIQECTRRLEALYERLLPQ